MTDLTAELKLTSELIVIKEIVEATSFNLEIYLVNDYVIDLYFDHKPSNKYTIHIHPDSDQGLWGNEIGFIITNSIEDIKQIIQDTAKL